MTESTELSFRNALLSMLIGYIFSAHFDDIYKSQTLKGLLGGFIIGSICYPQTLSNTFGKHSKTQLLNTFRLIVLIGLSLFLEQSGYKIIVNLNFEFLFGIQLIYIFGIITLFSIFIKQNYLNYLVYAFDLTFICVGLWYAYQIFKNLPENALESYKVFEYCA